ncbi:MAG: hypothetical protein HYS38_03435 [Acidobacteria bacterium]|nr:hypothetical protein [Acidobacteriota bacterium]
MIYALKLVTSDAGETASVELIPIETLVNLEEALQDGTGGQYAIVIAADNEEEAKQVMSRIVKVRSPRPHQNLM